MTPVTQHRSNGRLFTEQLLAFAKVSPATCPAVSECDPMFFASFPQIRCNLSRLFSGTREASCLEQAEHPAAQTLGKASSRLRVR